MSDEIERARRVATADAFPWDKAYKDADDLRRATYEPLLDFADTFGATRNQLTGRAVMVPTDDWRRLMVSYVTALSVLREALPEEVEGE